jgi:hypothetical protein
MQPMTIGWKKLPRATMPGPSNMFLDTQYLMQQSKHCPCLKNDKILQYGACFPNTLIFSARVAASLIGFGKPGTSHSHGWFIARH